MRPTRLELAGFGSFREPIQIDLADAELFVLVGPTGAGKSTIIDALVFALYGSVPRYEDRRLVAPVISQGRVEAKVRLDFVVDGVGYTAVRVVRRTAAGATTKEARLERADPAQTLAGNEKELTQQVERLLGLSFDHFTRCVVLPQGAFAEFLHARPSERHHLLVELLGIDVYRRIARRAREHGRLAADRAAQARDRLHGDLADATPAAQQAAAQRVDQLERLRDRVIAAQPRLERLREDGAARRAAASEARSRRALLDGLALPDGLNALSGRLERAAQARADAAEAVDKAVQQRQAADEARSALPTVTVLAELHRLITDRDRRADELAPAAADVTGAREGHRRATSRLEQARRATAEALAALHDAQHRNMAHALAEGLAAGDDCPVCTRTLTQAPAIGDAGDLEQARAAHTAATEQLASATGALQAAAAEVARAETAHTSIAAALDELSTRATALSAEHAIDLGDVARLVNAATEAEQDARAAERAERDARATLRSAERAQRDLAGARTAAWAAFDAARDRVGALRPPPVERTHLATAWHELLTWADQRRPALDEAASAAQRAVEQIVTQWLTANAELVEACRDADVVVEHNDPVPASVAALERARAHLRQVTQMIATAEELRARAATDEALAETAGRLVQQLGTKRFEQWLLNQALGRLVIDASARLRDLTSGAYSLDVDDAGGFQVIDHRNADELRSARTLSGGETFLASLALALALSDHVAELAAGSGARLDALFLDEGFGTLDQDTLDVVASALEELGSRGRIVGLVTHVRELADRMPVRFEVRRTAQTSTVDRVEL